MSAVDNAKISLFNMLSVWARYLEEENKDYTTRSGLKKLWTTEAPARREATTMTDDHANEGVPVGRLPPNFWFIFSSLQRRC